MVSPHHSLFPCYPRTLAAAVVSAQQRYSLHARVPSGSEQRSTLAWTAVVTHFYGRSRGNRGGSQLGKSRQTIYNRITGTPVLENPLAVLITGNCLVVIFLLRPHVTMILGSFSFSHSSHIYPTLPPFSGPSFSLYQTFFTPLP